jgi:hypothetical protein
MFTGGMFVGSNTHLLYPIFDSISRIPPRLKIAFGCERNNSSRLACRYLIREHGGLEKIIPDKGPRLTTVIRDIEKEHRSVNIFVPNLRYRSDYETLQQHGFVMVRIITNTSECTYQKNTLSPLLVDRPLDDWDHIIYDDDTEVGSSNLYDSLDDLVEDIRKI